jgi:general secretion pathway protein I
MKRSLTTERGFTLLEVLVAFSIFTVSLGIIFQIFSKGTRAVMLSDEYTQAVFIAQSRLASAGIEGDLDVGEYSGKENEIYSWTTTVRPYESTDELETTYHLSEREIEVTVNWNSRGKERSIKLNTLRLIPTT